MNDWTKFMDIKKISDIVSIVEEGVIYAIEEMLKSVEVEVYLEKRPLTEDMVIGWIFCELHFQEAIRQ